MMMRKMTKLIYRLLILQLLFILVLFVQGYWYWLLNFELAFVSAMFIIAGSFSGYKRMVDRRLEVGEGMNDAMLEKIEDPHELYDEDEPCEEVDQELSAVIKEEKKRLKQNKQTLKKTIKSTPGIFSPWRFIPYIVLVLSFIGLNNNHVLDIPAFLIGLAAGIISAVLIGKRWISSTSL